MTTNTASLLREARLAAGLTQAELARLAHTSQPAVATYEAGRRTPALSTLTRLLSACGHELVLDAQAPEARAAFESTMELLQRQRGRLAATGRAHGVSNLRVFGSTARGDGRNDSDVDLLVDLDPERTLIDLAAFRADAEALLGVPIDAATIDLLKPHVRDAALAEAMPL